MKASAVLASKKRYCDSSHPRIRQLAFELAQKGEREEERFEHLFYYVRDHVLFGFPPAFDQDTASDTLIRGIGYCNTKSPLLVALCRAAGIPARLHTGLIDIRIMEGIIPSWAIRMLPAYVSHMWVEVHLHDGWHPVDAHILDYRFFQAAQTFLSDPQTEIGYGIAYILPACNDAWNSGFVQSNAVLEDHGTWDDAADYYASPGYVSLKWWQLMSYPILQKLCNRNIAKIRSRYACPEQQTIKEEEQVGIPH